MNKVSLLACLTATALLSFVASVEAAEIRTYRFVPDGSLPFRAMFAERIGNAYARTADISGEFKVSLDLAAGVGTVLTLDDELVNVHDHVPNDTSSGLVPTPVPATGERFITSPDADKNPPLVGTLTNINGELHLLVVGAKFLGDRYEFTTQISIKMKDQQATVSMALPYELSRTVNGAKAVQVIPEPSAFALAAVAVPLVLSRRQRRNTNLPYESNAG